MNTFEKGLTEIQRQYKVGIDYSDGKDETALCLYSRQAEAVIKELGYRTAKKPKYQAFYESVKVKPIYKILCPSCGYMYGVCETIDYRKTASSYGSANYCCGCGQKIDWSGEK